MRFVDVLLGVFGLPSVGIALGCGSPAKPAADVPRDEPAALSRAALDTLEREACPRLLTRTFPLAEPRGTVSTGRLWVRRCAAKRSAGTLDLDVDVLGWQWSGEESWGFAVREYVYFSASIHARLNGAIEADGDRVNLRVWSDTPPDVTVREIGRVDARASTPAASMLGVAAALVGQGPNVLATAALRGRVRDLIAERAVAGIPIVIGEAPALRVPGTSASDVPGVVLLDETERLHPGGALISGSYAAGASTTLRWSVDGDGVALARPVCVDEALELVDAVVAERAPSAARPLHDVVTLAGRGEATLPALGCPWVLVTGARDDRAVSVALKLTPRVPHVLANSAHRWLRATLVAYELTVPKSTAVVFSIGPDDAPRSFGRALPEAKSPAVGLVAPLFELARGAPVTVRALEQHPRAPSFWNPSPGFDESLLARGAVELDPHLARQEQSVPLSLDGHTVGMARVRFEAIDVE
jgi:hypothetical protein